MASAFADWLDDRTGLRSWWRSALEAPVPGGARWRYVFGAMLTSAFVIQLVTGLLLMLSYSPSATTAWGSVYYINERMAFGWFIRGLHHFGSGAMMTLAPLHLMQVVAAGAYRRPREFNWWLGLVLLVLVFAFGLTGYLLPWDQKGYWASRVFTSIVGGTPFIGPYLQTLLVGGSNYGNQTITRFFGLHVGILPLLFFAGLSAHLVLVRRHGLTPPRSAERRPAAPFWPEQAFRFTIASVAVFVVLATIVLINHGANLEAPADPSSTDYPARPEWYFLSFFQLLKVLPGKLHVLGTIVIPVAIFVVLIVLPLLDRIMPTKLAHFLACAFVFGMAGGIGYLMVEAVRADAHDQGYIADRARADETRQRAFRLASDPRYGIPPEGAAYVLYRDPLTRGKEVLETACLTCHYYGGEGQTGSRAKAGKVRQVASDLKDFGAYAWVRGLLENPRADAYFGKVPHLDGMVEWKRNSKLKKKQLDDVARFVASFATIPPDLTPEEWLNMPGVADHPGLEPFVQDCGKCHVIEGLTEEGQEPIRDAPKLFAWGSPQWIARMIHKPGAPDLYGYLEKPRQMPAFSSDEMTDNDVTTLIRYLKNDYLGAPSDGQSVAKPESGVAVNR